MNRNPGQDAQSDEINTDDDDGKGCIEKLMGQLNAGGHRFSPGQGTQNENVRNEKSTQVYSEQAGVDALKKQRLAMSEQSYPEDSGGADKNKFRLPADMPGRVAKRSFQIHQDADGDDDPEDMPQIT